MSMKANTRQVDGVTIVDLSGRITLGEGSVILRDTVRDLVGKGEGCAHFGVELHVALKALHQVKPIAGLDAFGFSLDDYLEHIKARKALVDLSYRRVVGRVGP